MFHDHPIRFSLAIAVFLLASACGNKPPGPEFEHVSFEHLSAFNTGEPTTEELFAKAEALRAAGKTPTLEEMESFQTVVPTITLDDIPDSIRAYHGRKISVTGYMFPFDMNERGITGFLLLKDQTLCCYGVTPRLNDFVLVKLSDGLATEYVRDFPVTVFGAFEVGMREDENLRSIYRLSGVRVDIPQIHYETKKSIDSLQDRLLDRGAEF